MKKISVIIPIYNSEKFLNKCLDSVINQTYQNIEIILVNDGSTDRSLDICREYENINKNIILINQKNCGQGKARNEGIKKATGHYLTFVDSDDWIDLKMLEKMYDVSDNGNIDIIVIDLYKVISEKSIYYKNLIKFTDNNINNLIVSHPGPVAKLIKRDLLINNNLFFLEGKIYEDLGLIPLVAIHANSITYLEKAYYYYYIRENSTMKKIRFDDKIDDIFYVMRYLDDNIGKANFKKELEYLYIEHLLYSASLRYLKYHEGQNRLKTINCIIKTKYPKFYNNFLFKKRNVKFKIITLLIYFKLYLIIKLLMKVGDR